MQIYGWELLKVCHHLGKSREHRHYDSGDLIFLIRHVSLANTCLMGYVNLWVKSPHKEPPGSHVCWPLVYWKGRYKVFNMSRDLTKPLD